jgi:hypothetical protein
MSLTLVSFAGCTAIDEQPRPALTTQQANTDLADALTQLGKIHNDRISFSTFVAVPFIHTVDKDVKTFTDWMGEKNAGFGKEIQAYAKKKSINIRYKFGPDVMSQSQKLLEAKQGEVLMNAGSAFSHYVLLFAFIDHSWGNSVLETTLKLPNLDSELKEILTRDLEMHKEALARIAELLKKYKAAK